MGTVEWLFLLGVCLLGSIQLSKQEEVLWKAVLGASLEVGIPERFLRPRNFNPHPYTDVLDPGLAEDDGRLGQPQLLPAQLSGYVRENLPQLPEHPYALFKRPLSRGDDGRAPIQFPKVPEDANIPAPRQRLKPASIKHPLNLGSIPQQRLFSPNDLSGQKKKYAFSYAVLDKSSGDDFSHAQLGSGGQTKGEYRVKLPDGRTQVVSYTADHRGYRADVRYDKVNAVEEAYTRVRYVQPAEPRPHHVSVEPQHPGTLYHRVAQPLQLNLPKPAYKTLLLEYDDTTLPPIRDHTPIHEDQDDDYGDYRENSVSSTPGYGGLRPSLIRPVAQQVQQVQQVGGFGDLGERAGPVKFPPNPPPQPQQETRFVSSTPSPVYSSPSPTPSTDGFYFTSPSPVKLFLSSDGQIYSHK